MIKELIKLANELDRRGYREHASRLDSILVGNKEELNKFAGEEVSAEEAMAHEERSPFEESPGYEAEQHLDEYKKLQMAERVAELVVGLDPEAGGRAEDDMAQELAEILSQDQHAETVGAILRFIDGHHTGE